MALLSTPIPNLVNGISQQSPTLRLLSELEAQDNCYSSVLDGLSKRPPTNHIAQLADEDISDAHIHTINRDVTERYTLVLQDGALRVFDMDGVEKTVNVVGSALDYLEATSGKAALRAVTVEDYTFILNTEVEVEMGSSLSPFPGEQGIVFVKQGQYATKYSVNLNSFDAADKTTSASDSADIQTTQIAEDLAGTINTNINSGPAVTTATWVEGGFAAEGTKTVSSWTTQGGRPRPQVISNGYAVDDIIVFSGTSHTGSGFANGVEYRIKKVINASVFELDLTVTGSITGGTCVRVARKGERRAGTLTQTGAFTGYIPARGDHIVLVSGTGITIGSYEIASKVVWGTSAYGSNFIELLTSPSTAHVNLATADIASDSDWLVTFEASTILIKRADGGTFTLKTSDSFGDRALFGFKDKIQKFTDLPTVAVRDYTVKITGENATDDDDYWVKFVPNNDAVDDFDKGIWVECVAPNIPYEFDDTTMPHVLVREEDGTFTFKAADWGEREAGDLTTAPNPSFVGKTISDIFFTRNRLGFLSGTNTIMSRDNSVFDFFPTTVLTLLDSDPIDVFTPEASSDLRYAVPFQEQLLIFTDQAQFVLDAPGLLTAQTVTIKPTTKLEANLSSRPVGAGNNVYFAFPRGQFSGIWEYYVDDQTLSKDAADITAHVPKYIPKNPFKIAASTTENLLAVLSAEDPSAVYLYKYFWRANEKIQSSWSRFSFEEASQVLNVDFIGSKAYVVVQRADGAYLESIDFEPGAVDEDSAFVMCLDRRLTEEGVTSSYDIDLNVTTWTLPYEITGPMRVVVRGGDEDRAEGQRFTLLSQTGTEIKATGDLTGTLVYIGQEYDSSWQFSQQFFHTQGSNGQSIVANGRWQLRTCTLVYNNTGYFKTSVTPVGRDTSVKEFSNVTLGVDPLGVARLGTDRFRFAVLSNSQNVVIVVSSDSHLPFHITSAEFEGEFSGRSGRA